MDKLLAEVKSEIENRASQKRDQARAAAVALQLAG